MEYVFSFVLVKYLAYGSWCSLGVRLFRSREMSVVLRAGFAWGALRLVMGFAFGSVILLLVNHLYASDPRPSSLGLYLLTYVPVRVVEWVIMLALIVHVRRKSPASSARPFRCGLWVAGGIVVSCLADIPVFLVIGGFPIGRFLC